MRNDNHGQVSGDSQRRWVLYASSGAGDRAFANAVSRAGDVWKPMAVRGSRVDETIRAVEPEAVVVSTRQPNGNALLEVTFARHAGRRVVIDDRHLNVLTRLLNAAR